MEMEEHMFSDYMFAGPPVTMEHREDFDQRSLARFPPAYQTRTSSC